VVIHQETGLLVPPKNPAALAEAILEMYRHRDKAREMGQRGYEVVHQKFSAEAMAAKVIEVYRKLFKASKMEMIGDHGSGKN